jgi:hypothetical protein
MESNPFKICPFCQATSPISEPRCPRCRRSLAGLTLPVYGSEVDAALAPPETGPLVDLPLRDAAAAPAPAVEPAPAAPPLPPPAADRRRIGAAVKMGIAAAIMVAMLVGGWLVRAQDRHQGDARSDDRAATSVPPAPVTATAAAPLATAAPTTVASVPVPSSPITRKSTPPRPRAIERTATARADERPSPEPPDFPVVSDPPARTPSRPAAAPITPPVEVETVRPDVRAAPVGVERARGGWRRDRAARGVPDRDRGTDDDVPDAAVDRAELRAQLRAAVDRREILAAHVDRLRARTNVPVVKDVEEYQRAQEALSAALDRLDAVDAEVARLRRALSRDQ